MSTLRPSPLPGVAALRWSQGRRSIRVRWRAVTVSAVLLALTVAVVAVTLGTGDTQIAPPDILRALLGDGTRVTEFLIMELRLPRALVALTVGAALGAAGAVFQSLTRNPLGSPDIIGLTAGSAAGALLALIVLGGGVAARSVGAVTGGVATAALVYLLAYRGGVQGLRLVLTGVGVGATLTAVNSYLLVRANIADAIAAGSWLVGSLNGRSWDDLVPVGAAVAVLLPAAVLLGRHLRILEMGDDAAAALGIPVERTRLGLLTAAVLLTAVAASVTGPIQFIALAAPQLARRLTRVPGVGVASAACMGAFLMTVSDLAAQRLFAPTQVPVGAATLVLGGGYLAWLLARERTRA